jgi:hypothetical protein
MNPADVQLLLYLIEIAQKATAAIKAIKDDKPEVYAEVGKHHGDALARLEAAAEG